MEAVASARNKGRTQKMSEKSVGRHARWPLMPLPPMELDIRAFLRRGIGTVVATKLSTSRRQRLTTTSTTDPYVRQENESTQTQTNTETSDT